MPNSSPGKEEGLMDILKLIGSEIKWISVTYFYMYVQWFKRIIGH